MKLRKYRGEPPWVRSPPQSVNVSWEPSAAYIDAHLPLGTSLPEMTSPTTAAWETEATSSVANT